LLTCYFGNNSSASAAHPDVGEFAALHLRAGPRRRRLDRRSDLTGRSETSGIPRIGARDMAAMTRFDGFSRTSYDYVRADLMHLSALSTQGGNYVFAARVGGSPVIVYAAETDSIRTAVANHPRWAEACDKHGALFIFIHMNPNPALRRLEVHDLIRKHDPPMTPRSEFN
jgi:hypothetical protein